MVGPSNPSKEPAPGGQVRQYELTAAPARIQLGDVTTDAWAFNGTVPGPELRVTTGDLIRVSFHNRLPAPSTIHWHGVPLQNGQDGVAGVTQDPVPSGGTATYAFIAPQTGTYWYHPHQHSAEQEDKGLYGALVVDPREAAAAAPRNQATLIYDEWPLGTRQPAAPPGDDQSMAVYGIYTVNGKYGRAIPPIQATAGQRLRLRLINAGFLTHLIHVHGAPVTITGLDGAEVSGGSAVEGPLPLAAAERIQVDLQAPGGAWSIHLHDGVPPAAQATVRLVEPSLSGAQPGAADAGWRASAGPVDLFAYGGTSHGAGWKQPASPSKRYSLHLTEQMGSGGMNMPGMSHGSSASPGMNMPGMSHSASPSPGVAGMEMKFLIDGKAFPHTQNLLVTRGDAVTLTFANDGMLEHPMHLHGHDFQLLDRNGIAARGALLKDTVLVRPGERITVGFIADNPGIWMIHCHELHHAAAGMDTLLQYAGAPRLAQLGGQGGGSAE